MNWPWKRKTPEPSGEQEGGKPWLVICGRITYLGEHHHYGNMEGHRRDMTRRDWGYEWCDSFEEAKEIAVDYVTFEYGAAEGTMMRATREAEKRKAELDAVVALKKEDVSGYPWRGEK